MVICMKNSEKKKRLKRIDSGISSENDEMMRMVKILIAVVLVLGAFYLAVRFLLEKKMMKQHQQKYKILKYLQVQHSIELKMNISFYTMILLVIMLKIV